MATSQYPEWSGPPTLNFWQGDPPKSVPLWKYIRGWPSNLRQYLLFAMETDPDGASVTPSAPLPTGVTLTGTNNHYVTYPGSGGTNGITTGIQFRVTDTRNGVHRSSPLTQVKIAGTIVLTPTQPTNFTVTAKSASSIEITWTAGAGGSVVTAYHLFRAPSQSGPYVEISANATSPYTDSGLEADRDYWYTVAAEDANGAFSGSTVAHPATTFAGAPAAPVGLSAYGVDADVIRVSWIAGSGGATADHFVLYHAASAGGSYTPIDPAVSPYDHAGNDPLEEVFFKVRAVDASSVQSADSEIVSATTLANPVPNAPSSVTATAISNTTIEVAWAAAGSGPAVTGYRVFQATASTGPFTQLAQVGASTFTAQQTGLTEKQTRYYQVAGYNAAGESQRSLTVNATTVTEYPSTPAQVTVVSVSETTLRVSWIAGTGGSTPVTYRIHRASAVGGPYTPIATDATSPYDDASLSAGQTRHYKVSALDAEDDESAQSAAGSGTTVVLTPSTPINVAAAGIATNQIRVSWSPGSGGSAVTAYRVYRSYAAEAVANNEWFLRSEQAASPLLDTESLSPGESKWYSITAIDGSAQESSKSVVVSATTFLTTPNAPINVSAVGIATDQIRVTWAPATTGSPAVSYQVHVSTASGGTYTSIGTPTAATFTHTGLAPGAVRYYKIKSVDANGSVSAFSAVASGTAQVQLLPSTPINVGASGQSQTMIRVNWTPGPDGSTITGYKIFRGNAVGGPFTQIATDTASPYDNTGLTAGQTFWYCVVATDGTYDSAQSLVVKATSTPIQTGTATLQDDFQSGTVDLNKFSYSSGGGAPQAVNVSQAGSRRIKFEVRNNPGEYRSELSIKTPAFTNSQYTTGRDMWVGFRVWIPTGFGNTSIRSNIIQIHKNNNGQSSVTQPMWTVAIVSNQFSCWRKWATGFNGPEGSHEFGALDQLRPIVFDQDIDIVFFHRFDHTANGVTRLWIQGALEYEAFGGNIYYDTLMPYYKMGIYAAARNNANRYPGQVIYHDRLRIAEATSDQNLYDFVDPANWGA